MCIGLICWNVVCAVCDFLILLTMLTCTCTLSSLCKCLVSIRLLRMLVFAYTALTCLHGAYIALAQLWVVPSGGQRLCSPERE